ncbi:MAG: glutathione S-transferase family protein [Alphaproteobacteria bacterium]|nr:glutathione S-transferase family protein [Alphaproteobacteria bacterium]MDE2110015.1 glutathione S-transferase family protein [Alphaproteobacteria bacterium]MDE2492947.1 glutathione S-transferase family protein [Alphaproteobacteria bacterium]
MKLYMSPASPFARKARIVVRELDLARLVEEIPVNPATSEELHRVNPLRKIPALVLGDGSALIDSPVICEYLNELGGGKFFPGMSIWREVSGRWRALGLQALGDGIAEAAVARVYESRRPENEQSKDMLAKYLAQIARALDALERAKFAKDPTIGEIAVACALGYLDFRLPELNWRETRPQLAAWYETFAKYPSMQSTWPANLA